MQLFGAQAGFAGDQPYAKLARRLAQFGESGDAGCLHALLAPRILEAAKIGEQRPATGVGGEQHDRPPERCRTSGQDEGGMDLPVAGGGKQDGERPV